MNNMQLFIFEWQIGIKFPETPNQIEYVHVSSSIKSQLVYQKILTSCICLNNQVN